MDTGENPVVPPRDIHHRLGELSQVSDAQQKWMEDFATLLTKVTVAQGQLDERIDTLVDLVNANDAKTNMAMQEIRNTAQKLDNAVADIAHYAEWIGPKMKLEEAKRLVEEDALALAEKWRRRIHTAWPLVKLIFVAGALASGVIMMAKGGPNILPWIFK